MISTKTIGIAILVVGTALFFQNCGKVGFSSLNSSPTLSAQSTPVIPNTPPGPTSNSNPTTNTNTNVNTNTNAPTNGNAVTPTPPTTTSVASTGDDTDNSLGQASGDSSDDADLVECDLGANAKVVFNPGTTKTLADGSSNAVGTRVCMSKHACLDLVNAYAQSHNCTLAVGAATSPNNTTSCTQVFPGSEGVCNNAQILSDDAVESILTSMSTTAN